ncbi:MAG: hypothetical protein NTY87_12310 [Planctomycetia bacterium]|nr:hypothetical protein [Planctomycetia bacterium]
MTVITPTTIVTAMVTVTNMRLLQSIASAQRSVNWPSGTAGLSL